MGGLRKEKLASLIRQPLAQLIQREFPELANCLFTVSYVRVSADISWVDIFCTSLLEDDAHRKQIEVLQQHDGSLRFQLCKELHIRKMPALRFYPDQVSENTRRIDDLLNKKT